MIVVDRNEATLELARSIGAEKTVLADGSQVKHVMDLTDGKGAHVVMDFVGEQGAEAEGWEMTRRSGSHYVIGYGGTVNVPTIDVISTERNIVGNLVGTYNDLAELMVLAAQGKVTLHTSTLRARRSQRGHGRPRWRSATRAGDPGSIGHRGPRHLTTAPVPSATPSERVYHVEVDSNPFRPVFTPSGRCRTRQPSAGMTSMTDRHGWI